MLLPSRRSDASQSLFTRVTGAESIHEKKFPEKRTAQKKTAVRRQTLRVSETLPSNSSGAVGFVHPDRKEQLDLMCRSVFFVSQPT